MKQIITIILILFISFKCFSQVINKNQQSDNNTDNIELQLEKAIRLKKTGTILTAGGAGTAIIGLLLTSREATFPVGFTMLLSGSAATVIGIPVLITGHSRLRKTNYQHIQNQKAYSVIISPSTVYNNETGKTHPGFSLTVSF